MSRFLAKCGLTFKASSMPSVIYGESSMILRFLRLIISMSSGATVSTRGLSWSEACSMASVCRNHGIRVLNSKRSLATGCHSF